MPRNRRRASELCPLPTFRFKTFCKWDWAGRSLSWSVLWIKYYTFIAPEVWMWMKIKLSYNLWMQGALYAIICFFSCLTGSKQTVYDIAGGWQPESKSFPIQRNRHKITVSCLVCGLLCYMLNCGSFWNVALCDICLLMRLIFPMPCFCVKMLAHCVINYKITEIYQTGQQRLHPMGSVNSGSIHL